MNKVVCTPPSLISEHLTEGVDYFAMFKSSGRHEVSTVGTGIPRGVELAGLCPVGHLGFRHLCACCFGRRHVRSASAQRRRLDSRHRR